ncbi:MAG: hypothetical protein KDI66_14515 [Xanthomonadales bacterium]|nr:hypothetical protein [Xanthomonadales bacterium]
MASIIAHFGPDSAVLDAPVCTSLPRAGQAGQLQEGLQMKNPPFSALTVPA